MRINWAQFDPDVYVNNNYLSIHDEDREIIQKLISFYEALPHIKLALEIGVGPNLYPVMAMLPFVDKVECVDFSTPNLIYLKSQLKSLDGHWHQYWKLYKSYSEIYCIDLVKNIRKKMEIKKGNIYKLEANKYDLASMFFVPNP